ncbi:transposase [Streptomyces sp. NPDC026665]|uniref:transposase n=1 Tax=Streptomyces sp. NPDC026665 TaxID=3154798 RepID=UPI0033FB6DB0
MTPPRGRTWGRRGQTPVVRVRGLSRWRISLAALCCYRPRARSRPPYRPRFHALLKGARKSFTRQDHHDPLVRAHLQLGAPIIIVRDNPNTHRAAGMRKYAADHERLTIVQPPSYSPDLHPVEDVWSLPQRGWITNTAFTDPDHLTRTLRQGLAHIQRHPELIDGCLTETGLTPTPDHPKTT